MSSEWAFFWVTMPVVMVMFGSWIAFTRLVVARIERQLKAGGRTRPCPWDGPGGRVVLYAYAIAFSSRVTNRIHTGLIDASLIRRYARSKDRWLAIILLVSGNLLIFLGLWGAFYLGFY